MNTKGDYRILDLNTGKLDQLGRERPSSSLMFAKISPDGKYAAYVSGNNIYMEDLSTQEVKPLTTDGTITLINGTFDWAYGTPSEFFSTCERYAAMGIVTFSVQYRFLKLQ